MACVCSGCGVAPSGVAVRGRPLEAMTGLATGRCGHFLLPRPCICRDESIIGSGGYLCKILSLCGSRNMAESFPENLR